MLPTCNLPKPRYKRIFGLTKCTDCSGTMSTLLQMFRQVLLPKWVPNVSPGKISHHFGRRATLDSPVHRSHFPALSNWNLYGSRPVCFNKVSQTHSVLPARVLNCPLRILFFSWVNILNLKLVQVSWYSRGGIFRQAMSWNIWG